jgi:hypothetical protein
LYFHSFGFVLLYYSIIVSVGDPKTYCTTFYCMDLTLEGLKITQESRNMQPCSCKIIILRLKYCCGLTDTFYPIYFINTSGWKISTLNDNWSLKTITKMMIDTLIKAGRPDTSCTRACYIRRPIVFLRFRCTILILLIKTVRCSIPHCISYIF